MILNIFSEIFITIKTLKYKLQKKVFLDIDKAYCEIVSPIFLCSFSYYTIETNEWKLFPLSQIFVAVKVSIQ